MISRAVRLRLQTRINPSAGYTRPLSSSRILSRQDRVPQGHVRPVAARSRLQRAVPQAEIPDFEPPNADIHPPVPSQPVYVTPDSHGVLTDTHGAHQLLANDALVVVRQLEMLNVFIGYEQANRYAIYNPGGELVGFLAEEEQSIISTLSRQFLRTHRPFKATIMDRAGNPILWVRRPLQFINSKIYVHAAEGPEGRLVGETQQEWHPWRRRYNVFQQREEETFKQFARVDSGFLAWDFWLKDKDDRKPTYPLFIPVYLSQSNSKPMRAGLVASINRNFRGFGRELFTDTGQYAIRFDSAGTELDLPPGTDVQVQGQTIVLPEEKGGLTLDQRAMTLATAVSIDFDYFSRHSGSGGMGFPFMMWGMGDGSSDAAAEQRAPVANPEDMPEEEVWGEEAGGEGIDSGDFEWSRVPQAFQRFAKGSFLSNGSFAGLNAMAGPSLVRHYTPAAAAREAEADDDFFDIPPPPPSQSQPEPTASPDTGSEAASSSDPEKVPFTALKGKINHDTLKALTFRPFQLEAMSEVQKQVLSLMPGLSGAKLRGAAKDAVLQEGGDITAVQEGEGRKDLLVKAKTGTGKTIAFLVPAIDARYTQLETLSKAADENGNIPDKHAQGQNYRRIARGQVGSLIISPTRELATQIANEALKVCTWHKDFNVQLFVGGASKGAQMGQWRRGRKDIVVATPGRLCDMLNDPMIKEAVQKTDLLILDEADTLLEMGFKTQLEEIISALPQDRQTFLFSATVSSAIAQIARKSLHKNHLMIDCVPKNESNVHLHIPQYVHSIPAGEQLAHVLRLVTLDQLVNHDNSKIILFLPTTKLTMLYSTFLRELSALLPDSRTEVREIHSGLSQDRRTRSSERFRRDRKASILVTSDVSARGVDYPGVTRVIQIGVPTSGEQYIHRVGRTGRAGKSGGRGDLILMPWEQSFIKNELKQVPIKPCTPEDVMADINEIGSSEVQEMVEKIDEKVKAFLPTLDNEAINEVFTSLLGYYAGRREMLGMRGGALLVDELKTWATDAGGMEQRPHVSDNYLAKIGLRDRGGGSEGGRRSYGASRGGGGFVRGSRNPPRRSSGFGGDGGDREGGFTGGYGGGREGGFGGGGRREGGGFGGRRDGGFGGDRDGQSGGRREGGFGGGREGGFGSGGGSRFGSSSAGRSSGFGSKPAYRSERAVESY